MCCPYTVYISILYRKYVDSINKTIKLEIMRTQLNPKPHLTKLHTPLVWALPCQQCSLGNEEWVGVCDLTTCQQLAQGSAAHHQQTSPRAQLQLNRSPSFSHTEGEPTVLQLCCKTSANWGRWRGNCITHGCCVASKLNSLLTFWACYQFYMVFLRGKEHKLMAC